VMERLQTAAGTQSASTGEAHRTYLHLGSAAVLFWVLSYFLFTARASLMRAGHVDLANGRRMLATFIGASALAAAGLIVGRMARKSASLAWIAVACAVPLGAVLVFAARLLLGWLLDASDSTLSSELLWVLVWSGYFLAALLIFLTLRSPGSRAAVGDMEQAPPLTTPSRSREREFWVNKQGFSTRVLHEHIDFAIAEGNYVEVHDRGTTGLVRGPLSTILASLGTEHFVRIHRGVVCRHSLITAVKRHPSGALQAVLEDGRRLPVGRRYAASLRC